MKTVYSTTNFNKYSSKFIPFNDYDTDKILFFDIETTGFSPADSIIYLIGGMYFENNKFKTVQFFAETKDDERELLSSFFEFMKGFRGLIHFNGEGFDIPFILEKCKSHGLDYDFSQIYSFDIYKDTLCIKKLIRTENFKQKTLEVFLGLNRTDMYDGGQLIKVYKDYIKKNSDDVKRTELLELLLLHNVEDIKGMYTLINLYRYKSIINGEFEYISSNFNKYTDINGDAATELILTFKLPEKLPSTVSAGFEEFYITAFDDVLKLKVTLHDNKIKFYYEDYKNYFYLPNEDKAIHKSVAMYVDKEFRKKATPANCYNRIVPDEAFLKDTAKIKAYVMTIIKFICK